MGKLELDPDLALASWARKMGADNSMRSFFTVAVSVLVVLFLTSSVGVASDDPSPDGWGGMVLDGSSPADAIRLFGKPAKDNYKVALDLPRPVSWLSERYKARIFRTFVYKKLQDYKQVQFSFLDDKLVAITMEAPNAEFEENWIDPDDLEQLFGVVFKPHRRQRNTKLPPPAEFQANAPTELKKDDYYYWYDMIAVSEKSFIIAVADNYKYISGLFEKPEAKRRKKINARGSKYPGYVSDIEILSRTLAP